MIYCFFIDVKEDSTDLIKDLLNDQRVNGVYDATDVYLLKMASPAVTLEEIECLLEDK